MYSETFMEKGAVTTGSGRHGYLTPELPLIMDASIVTKQWEVSNAVCRTWNQFAEHQSNIGRNGNYYRIRKLLPPIKGATLG
jgi:hypothetical protein